MLEIALVVPLDKWAVAMESLPGTIRFLAPPGYTVRLSILPDWGQEWMDFDQYESPEVILTLRKALGLEPA